MPQVGGPGRPSGISCGDATRKSQRDTLTRSLLACACAYAQAACALRLRSRLGRETPSGSPDAWLSGDPPAALVSPPAALSHQIPRSGDPLGLRSAPYACGTATPIGASCHNALNPTPFGFASRLRRETLLQRWSHQIPSEGNPHQVLAPQGTTLGSTGSPQHWLPNPSPC
ncbi:hypothetical protein DP113_19545 [Brasilonema octagenarum UFV-E1]|uniref:Uncharacterized protein n=1 Tax=Brasilonema sennae CENA114 TaxID=415709 RepID=A0A856MJK1_9CYAN|nr:hypothetical protein DP114_19620 [Brasilonema sennae CENA114]QDL16154.1 hypothetical protein DP113_19545 [Brasilonema octagenarum UFV-E1]